MTVISLDITDGDVINGSVNSAGVFQTLTHSNLSSTDFGIIALRDADNSITSSYGMSTKDLAMVVINLSNVLSSTSGLTTGAEIMEFGAYAASQQNSGQETLQHSATIQSIAFSPDGLQAASADSDGVIILWDVGTGTSIRQCTGHSEGVNGIAFNPDGDQLVSGGADNLVILWDVATGTETKSHENQGIPVNRKNHLE